MGGHSSRKYVYKGPELREGVLLSENHQWLGLAVSGVGEGQWAVGCEAGQVDKVYITEG